MRSSAADGGAASGRRHVEAGHHLEPGGPGVLLAIKVIVQEDS